jgi:ABC-type glycerol-3-phosphate transport system substrate-binding protein
MNLLEKVNIFKIYIKKVKKSIRNIAKNITINVKKAVFFAGRGCIFAGGKIAGISKKFAAMTAETAYKFGRICVFAAVKTAENTKKFAAYLKELMHPVSRADICILAALLIVILTPIVINLVYKLEARAKRVNLYLSVTGEEIFGKELMDTLIREFEEKNPDILLKFAYASAGVEPDVLFFNEGDYNAHISSGALMELNAFTNYESGGRQPAIPLVSFMDMLFYNIDILSAAGFDRPPKTREEFLTYARAVSRGSSGAAGCALSLSAGDRRALSRDVFSWVLASGGNLYSADENGVIVFNKIPANDISFFETLNREGLLAPNIFGTTGEERLEAFASGKTAMMIASTGVIPYLRAKMGDGAFGITTIPVSASAGKYNISLSSIYVGIFSGTAYPESAWSFLAFLAGKSSLLCEKLNAVPGMVSNIIPGDYVKDDPFYSKAWDIFESGVIIEGVSAQPGAKEYEAGLLEELQTNFENSRTAAR